MRSTRTRRCRRCRRRPHRASTPSRGPVGHRAVGHDGAGPVLPVGGAHVDRERQVVFGPTDRPSPQLPELASGAAGTTVATVTAGAGAGRAFLRGRDSDPGPARVAPAAVPMTSMVVRPRSTVAVAVNTPLPTAAGRPWTSTSALAGLTVPRTVSGRRRRRCRRRGRASATRTSLGAVATGCGLGRGRPAAGAPERQRADGEERTGGGLPCTARARLEGLLWLLAYRRPPVGVVRRCAQPRSARSPPPRTPGVDRRYPVTAPCPLGQLSGSEPSERLAPCSGAWRFFDAAGAGRDRRSGRRARRRDAGARQRRARSDLRAARAAGRVICWGEGIDGQLGDGTGTASPVPVAASAIAGASASTPASRTRARSSAAAASPAGARAGRRGAAARERHAGSGSRRRRRHRGQRRLPA